MKKFLQHTLNPQHIYCRLRGCGLSQRLSLILAAILERMVRPVIYRRPPRIRAAVFIMLALTITGCNSCAPIVGTGGQIDPAKIQAGIMYLESTEAAIESALAVAKVKYPEKSAAIAAQAGPVMESLKVAIAAFKAAYAAQDMTKAMNAWDVARPLITSAISVAAPYAIGALVK